MTSRDPQPGEPVQRWKPDHTRKIPSGPLWRETLAVTTFDARPQSIVVLSGPSIVPLALAVLLSIVSAALLFEIYTVSAAFSVLCVPLVIRWLWPHAEEREYRTAGATLHGADLPVFTTGPAAVGWWAMALTVLALAVTLALAVFSHLYLVYAGPDVPPVRTPPLGLAFLAVAVSVASAAAGWWSLRAIRRGDARRLRVGLIATLVVGAASVALLGADVLALGLRPLDHAYEAMFATLAGYQIGLALVGLAAIGFVLAQAWLGYFDARRHLAVENVVMLWAFIAVSAAVMVGTLYVMPYVFPVT